MMLQCCESVQAPESGIRSLDGLQHCSLIAQTGGLHMKGKLHLKLVRRRRSQG